MEKLRKFGLVIWRYKEKMVFAILVILLAYQVYEVVQEPEQFGGSSTALAAQSPPEPKPIPPLPVTQVKDYSSLHERNPFWYWSSQPQGGSSSDEEAALQIRLLDIQKNPEGGYSARIETQSPKWYREGEQFESYKLLKVDPEKRQAEVYSEKLGRNITLTQQ